MVVYIFGFIIAIIFAYLSKKFKKRTLVIKNNKKLIEFNIWAILSALSWILIATFRYDVGTDYYWTYLMNFQRVLNGEKGQFDIALIIISKIIGIFTDNYIYFFSILSIIFIYFIYKSIYERSVSIIFSIFILFVGQYYFFSLNVIRQFISIAIFMYALKYYENKDYKKYTIYILIASTFHQSILLTFILLVLGNKKINSIIVTVIITIIITFKPMIREIVQVISSYTKYGWYFGSKYDKSSSISQYIIENAIILLIFSIYLKKVNLLFNNKEQKFRVYYNIQLFALIFSVMTGIIPNAERLAWIFMLPQIISIPMFIKLEKNKYIKLIISCGILCLYLTFFYINVFLWGWNAIIPYKTIF